MVVAAENKQIEHIVKYIFMSPGKESGGPALPSRLVFQKEPYDTLWR